MTLLEKLNECRICKSNDIQIILKLKDTPLEDQFLQKKKYQPLYPLEVAMCQNCSYVFLPHVINPDTSYDDYIYESSVTVGLEDHYKTYAQEIIKSYKIKKNSLALDLGSNDGSMLKAFLKEDMKVLGVEPAKKISDFANEIKLRTINNFFSEELARKIIKEEGQASIITANYMFANIHNLKDFLSGVKLLLDNDGIFIIQTGYHPYQFSKNMFDYIYHEHFSYFTLKTLSYLLNDFELEIVDAKILKPKGGSIRVFVKNKSIKNLQSDRLKNLIYEEKKHKYNSHHIFTILNENISKERDKLITQLEV